MVVNYTQQNITYWIGAGASYNAIPIYNGISPTCIVKESIDKDAILLKEEYSESKTVIYKTSTHEITIKKQTFQLEKK